MEEPLTHETPEGIPPENRRVRMKDIARMTGYHVSTISSVLSPRAANTSRVSEETAGRIRDCAAKLNYFPDLHAQIMRKKRTGLLGVIEMGVSEISSRRVIALSDAARRRGYQIFGSNVRWHDSDARLAIDYVINARVEGVVLVTPSAEISPEIIYRIQERGVPCVTFNGVHLPGIPQVRTDVRAGMEKITAHLLGLGRRRLAFLGVRTSISQDQYLHWPTLERMEGFRKAIEAVGGYVVANDSGSGAEFFSREAEGPLGFIVLSESPKGQITNNAEHGCRIVRKILKYSNRPDAFMCTNDHFALGAIGACHQAGVSVPGEVAVTGFAGNTNGQFYSPPLTTVDTVSADDAEAVLELLFKQKDNKPLSPVEEIVRQPARLIVRESCGAGRKAAPINLPI